MRIAEINGSDSNVLPALNDLLQQLNPGNAPISPDDLKKISSSDTTHLFVAYDENGAVTGMLTLSSFLIPTGIKVWIDDVAVDSAHRGKGIGKALTSHALEYARSLGAGSVDLTSRPEREEANRLYTKIGFVKRTTNVYRYNL